MLEIFTFAMVNLLGCMSPGPDFAIVTRYGLTGSRKNALLATFGIATALLIHVLYCILGVALFLKSTPFLFKSLQIAGALYLGFLGAKMVLAKEKSKTADAQIPDKKAFFAGFFTNLLNPKATLFLLSLFTQFVTPATPFSLKILYGFLTPLTALFWFTLLSYLLTHPVLFTKVQKYQKVFTFLMGIFLLILSIYVIFNSLYL